MLHKRRCYRLIILRSCLTINFFLSPRIEVTEEGMALYKIGHNRMWRIPEAASED